MAEQEKIKIAGMMVVGEGEADRYLKRALDDLEPICDIIAIWGDCVDKKTADLCRSYDKVIFHNHYQKLWTKYQWRIKETLLTKIIAPLKPDWIACKDADEIYDKRFNRQLAEEMSQKDETAYHFRVITLWGDEQHQRIDRGWEFWNVRYFKFQPNLSQDYRPTPLHCGLAPIYAYQHACLSGFILKHLGYVRLEDQTEKRQRYRKHDPKAIYQNWNWYRSMNPDFKNIKVISFDEYKFINKMPPYVPSHPRHIEPPKRPTMKYYKVKNPAGKVYEVPETQTAELKTKGFQILGEISESESSIPLKEKPEVEETEVKEEAVKTRGKYDKKIMGEPQQIAQGGKLKTGILQENITEPQTEEAPLEKEKPEVEPDEAPDKFHICDFCGRVCKTSSGLQAHLRSHKKKQK